METTPLTKKQLEMLGWTFITTSGGAITASRYVKGEEERQFESAKTMLTLRKKCSQGGVNIK